MVSALRLASASALRLRQGRAGGKLVPRDGYHYNSQLCRSWLDFEPALAPGMNIAQHPNACVVLEDTIPANESYPILVQVARASLSFARLVSCSPTGTGASTPACPYFSLPPGERERSPGGRLSRAWQSGLDKYSARSAGCQFVESLWKG